MSASDGSPEGVLTKPSLISVVDDDDAFRDSMRRLLMSLGYAVAAFPSAAEFLAAPEVTTTECLIADIQMPNTRGDELYCHLMVTGHSIPTILVTAYPDHLVQARMLGLGVRCYLSKPLEEAALIKCLRSAVKNIG
jgi:FixJ family two-component response regulator